MLTKLTWIIHLISLVGIFVIWVSPEPVYLKAYLTYLFIYISFLLYLSERKLKYISNKQTEIYFLITLPTTMVGLMSEYPRNVIMLILTVVPWIAFFTELLEKRKNRILKGVK